MFFSSNIQYLATTLAVCNKAKLNIYGYRKGSLGEMNMLPAKMFVRISLSTRKKLGLKMFDIFDIYMTFGRLSNLAPVPVLSLVLPVWSLVVPAVSLALPLLLLDKMIQLLLFAVLVLPWLRYELNSRYQGSRDNWC